MTIGGETHDVEHARVLTDGSGMSFRASAPSPQLVKTSISRRGRTVSAAGRRSGAASTGVRPATLARGTDRARYNARRGGGRSCASSFHVSPERTALTIRAAATAMELDKSIGPDDISLYVGILFCPSRCYYCSFVSATTAQSGCAYRAVSGHAVP
ncbi:MAG: hypothetical protein ACLR4Z_01765 [Butyricicoccaceae bacterium]